MEPKLSPNLRPLRYCPNCGQRVAQKADTCFMCGAMLDKDQQRRFSLPVADLFLVVVVVAVTILWWARSPRATEVGAAVSRTVTSSPTATATSTPLPPTATPTATASPTATATPEPVVYTVVRGDTVEAIAKAFDVSVQDLMAANGMTSDLIQVDQKLVIPTGPVTLGPDGKPVPTNTPTPESAIYKVEARAGDTLESIAEDLDTTVDAIVAANDWIASTDVILIPGDVLLVPVGAAALTPVAPKNLGPTVTPVPTATPTPGLPWPAPQPLSPSHEAVAGEGSVLLQWLSVGTLADDEVYVVRVAPAGRLRDEMIDVTKATSYRVPLEWLERHASGSARFIWQVQVARDVRAVAGQAGGLRPTSANSPARIFVWRQAGATVTPQR